MTLQAYQRRRATGSSRAVGAYGRQVGVAAAAALIGAFAFARTAVVGSGIAAKTAVVGAATAATVAARKAIDPLQEREEERKMRRDERLEEVKEENKLKRAEEKERREAFADRVNPASAENKARRASRSASTRSKLRQAEADISRELTNRALALFGFSASRARRAARAYLK